MQVNSTFIIYCCTHLVSTATTVGESIVVMRVDDFPTGCFMILTVQDQILGSICVVKITENIHFKAFFSDLF